MKDRMIPLAIGKLKKKSSMISRKIPSLPVGGVCRSFAFKEMNQANREVDLLAARYRSWQQY